MNKDQISGLLRTLLAAGAGYAVATGRVDQETANQIVGGAVAIGVALWSFFSKKPAA